MARASPKSANFKTPSRVMRTLDDFISLEEEEVDRERERERERERGAIVSSPMKYLVAMDEEEGIEELLHDLLDLPQGKM